jgi:hypothetical protein
MEQSSNENNRKILEEIEDIKKRLLKIEIKLSRFLQALV